MQSRPKLIVIFNFNFWHKRRPISYSLIIHRKSIFFLIDTPDFLKRTKIEDEYLVLVYFVVVMGNTYQITSTKNKNSLVSCNKFNSHLWFYKKCFFLQKWSVLLEGWPHLRGDFVLKSMLWDFSKWPEYRGSHISVVLIRGVPLYYYCPLSRHHEPPCTCIHNMKVIFYVSF